MAEKREGERRRWNSRPARPAWCGESWIASSPVPSWSSTDLSPERLTTILIVRATTTGSRFPIAIALPYRWGKYAPSQWEQGITNPHNGTNGTPNIMLLHVQPVKHGIA